MKTRLFGWLGASALLALACSSEETDGAGGGGAASSADTTTTATAAAGTGGAVGAGGGGGGSQGTGCVGVCCKCSELLVTGVGVDPTQLCTDNGPPSSADLFEALSTCTCQGPCAEECAASVCSMAEPDQDCIACVAAPAPDGCSDEYTACNSDL
jgi:hypothetical protein